MINHLNEGGPGSGNFGHADIPGVRGGSAPGGEQDPLSKMSDLAKQYGFEPSDRKDTFRKTVLSKNEFGEGKAIYSVFYNPGFKTYGVKAKTYYITSFGPNSAGFELGSFKTPEEAFAVGFKKAERK